MCFQELNSLRILTQALYMRNYYLLKLMREISLIKFEFQFRMNVSILL